MNDDSASATRGDVCPPGLPALPSAAEWTRWALESPDPGALIRDLQCSGELGKYPEIAALIGVPQEPEWHPEGSVDRHTGFVLEAAAEIAAREALAPHQREVLLLAALAHDFGKPATTVRRKKGNRLCWTSYEHDEVGARIAGRFLRRLEFPAEVVTQVVTLVRHHMAYLDFREVRAGDRAVRRLAQRLSPVTVRQLGYLIEADHSGRPPLPKRLPDSAQRLLGLAERARVVDGVPQNQSVLADCDFTKSPTHG